MPAFPRSIQPLEPNQEIEGPRRPNPATQPPPIAPNKPTALAIVFAPIKPTGCTT